MISVQDHINEWKRHDNNKQLLSRVVYDPSALKFSGEKKLSKNLSQSNQVNQPIINIIRKCSYSTIVCAGYNGFTIEYEYSVSMYRYILVKKKKKTSYTRKFYNGAIHFYQVRSTVFRIQSHGRSHGMDHMDPVLFLRY